MTPFMLATPLQSAHVNLAQDGRVVLFVAWPVELTHTCVFVFWSGGVCDPIQSSTILWLVPRMTPLFAATPDQTVCHDAHCSDGWVIIEASHAKRAFCVCAMT